MRANACFFSFCALLLVLCVSGWCAAFQPPVFCLEQGGPVFSALTGSRVDKLFDAINSVNEQAGMRITTGMLNDVLADATARVQPPTDKGKRLKVYYMTQVGVRPPHFVIFCNRADIFHFSYQRYLENQIRATFGLEGTPVKITIREKGDKEG